MNIDNTWLVKGDAPGPRVAIFAGIHGNEQAGILALQELKDTLKLKSGEVYLVVANAPAVAARVRAVNKNLNRCFSFDNQGNTYEDERARDLMKLLDSCEALLDLHAFKDTEGEPFVICEQPGLDLASYLDAKIISTGWVKEEPGTADGYMSANGKIGICLECGPTAQTTHYKAFAVENSLSFLAYFGLIEKPLRKTSGQVILQAYKVILKPRGNFWLDPTLKNFQPLQVGQCYAISDKLQYIAQAGDCIIFPDANCPVGAEACIIGRYTEAKT